MNKVMSLHDAVAKYIENGDVLATGGFTTNRKPYAAVSEILRQGQKDFIVYAGPGGGEVDMLIGEGRVAAYINCYTANSGYTNVSRRFRAAIEKGQLTYEDYSQDVLMLMLHASSLGLPFLPVRLMQGSGLMKYWGISEEKRKTMPKMEDLKCVEIENPMVPGQKVVAVPVPRIDTALIHVQQASPDGTCIICGDEFHDIDIAVAARKTIVTCEEIVSNEYIRRDPTKTRIFGECVQAVVKAPYGAWPAQCYDYYDDDDAALKEYDKASKYQDKADAVEQLAKAAAKAVKALEKAPADEKLKLAAEAAENQVEDSNKEATMTEDEMVEAAIRAGEEAADNDFKLKFEQAQKELADVRNELDAAAEAQKAAEDKAKDATERTARLQADWENFRRRTANERIAERERATEKLVTALLPVIDDIERAIDHARSQELSDDFKQFVDGVDAVHAKLLDVFAHEGVEPIDPKGEAFDPLEHQAVGRVEDASQYDETVNDVYQKGYRMADRILRSAMVTVTYGGEKRPAPEPEAAPEDATADTAESTEE